MNNLNEIFVEIKSETESLAKHICKIHGYHTPYQIHFKNFESPNDGDDIMICPGNPVDILISHKFILWCLLYEKNIVYRAKLSSALEHMHYMHRTLSHIVSTNTSIVSRRDTKNWTKVVTPFIPHKIASQYLEIEYSVTVTDKVTGMSIELHGNDINELRTKAIERLSRTVFEREDLEELHEALEEINRQKKLKKEPEKIIIDGDSQQINVRVSYE